MSNFNKYFINTRQGNRNRDFLCCIVKDSNVFNVSAGHFDGGLDFPDAMESKIAIVKELKFSKQGKWSNSALEITLAPGAKLVAFKRPFDGWSESKDLVIQHIIADSQDHNASEDVTSEEAWLALEVLVPDVFDMLKKMEDMEAEFFAAFNPFSSLKN